MSVITIGVPYALIAVITTFAASAGIIQEALMTQNSVDIIERHRKTNKAFSEEEIEQLQAELKKVELDSSGRSYVTKFMDKETLLKTLKEHGDFSVQTEGEKIICSDANSKFEFYKKNENAPYCVDIYLSDDITSKVIAAKDTLNCIDEEYETNVQDRNYENLIRHIEEENIQIESEEVLEDNTIVLTINLE